MIGRLVYYKRSVSRLLRELGISHLSAQPCHPVRKGEVIFRRTFAAAIGDVPAMMPIKLSAAVPRNLSCEILQRIDDLRPKAPQQGLTSAADEH